MKYKDYYQTMGLTRDASQQDIKQAYRKLARQHHPDISKDPEGVARFQEVGQAYAVLKDPEKRLAYDQLGQQQAGQSFTPQPDWQQQFSQGQRDNATGFDGMDFEDLFAAFKTHRGSNHTRRSMATPGNDYQLSVAISLEQIYAGAVIEVRAEFPEIAQQHRGHEGAKTFQVTIPESAVDGTRLRLSGKGAPGNNGGPNGDLYIELAVEKHRLYRVEGRNLYLILPLTPWEVALGATVKVPTLGGVVELTIKPGTPGGQHIRLAKRGLKAADGSIGALYAVVNIVLPKSFTNEEQKLWRQLEALSSFQPRQEFHV